MKRAREEGPHRETLEQVDEIGEQVRAEQGYNVRSEGDGKASDLGEAELRRRLLATLKHRRDESLATESNGQALAENAGESDGGVDGARVPVAEGGDEQASVRESGGGRTSAEETAGAAETERLPEVGGIPNETLFVGNLSYRVSEAVIIKLFTPFGKVVREQFCYHMVGPRRGEPRGFCFVEYSNVEDATKAIRALHGRKLYGRPLRVRYMTMEGTRMDYSTSDASKATSTFASTGIGAKIPPAASAGGEPGLGAGVTKLALDKKVALLKLKLREGSKPGSREACK